jgi:hypothetical protein
MSSGDRFRLMGRGLSLMPKRRPTLFEVYISDPGQCVLGDDSEVWVFMERKRHNR